MDMDGSKDVEKKNWSERLWEAEVEYGRSYAPEFVRSLADQAIDTLDQWLKNNHLPEEVINLVQEVVILSRYDEMLKDGKLSEAYAVSLTKDIGNITESICRLGGTFCGGGSESNQRENVITWQPPVVHQDQK
jgi:hypothetical protein